MSSVNTSGIWTTNLHDHRSHMISRLPVRGCRAAMAARTRKAPDWNLNPQIGSLKHLPRSCPASRGNRRRLREIETVNLASATRNRERKLAAAARNRAEKVSTDNGVARRVCVCEAFTMRLILTDGLGWGHVWRTETNCYRELPNRARPDNGRNVIFSLGGGRAVICIKNRGKNRRTNKKPYFLYY
jgi:hypothetical protein